MKARHFGILLALGTLCRAWKANFSDATQCQNVTVEWSGGGERLGPPFVVRMAAFGLAPLIVDIPITAWSDATQSGSYSFAMPWPEGTRFVASMDDGFGLGKGGVTGIQTVKSSSDSGCISTTVTQPKHVFDVSGSYVQCSIVNMNWTEPTTSETRIAGLVPNGMPFQLDAPVLNSRSTTWNLNIPAGTAFVLIYTGGSGSGLTSPLLLSVGGSNAQCLASGVYPSATASQIGVAEATSTTSSTSAPQSTNQSPDQDTNTGPNLGVILGVVFGVLTLLLALGIALFLYMRRRRQQALVQPPVITKEINPGTEVAQLEGAYASVAPSYHTNGAVLPFVLPSGSASQQDDLSPPRGYTSGKHTARARLSRDTANASDDSYTHGTTLTTDASTMPPGTSSVQGDSDEPMFIRHQDAGAVPLPRAREVIELPPGYHQLPRRLPQPPHSSPSEATIPHQK